MDEQNERYEGNGWGKTDLKNKEKRDRIEKSLKRRAEGSFGKEGRTDGKRRIRKGKWSFGGPEQ